jgi:hypothetical protein
MSFDRFPSILRACWVEAALLADQHAKSKLVESDKFDEDCFEHG